jgi:GNAT superfamily N-acetyltransferase
VRIEALAAEHRQGWDRLWAGYLDFYRADVPAEATEATWARLTGDEPAVAGLVALDADGAPIGILHRVLHATTWDVRPACYLEDLFVDPAQRGRGVGRALVEALVAEGRGAGWSSVHWITAQDNPARSLYRAVATETTWVRYEVDLPAT